MAFRGKAYIAILVLLSSSGLAEPRREPTRSQIKQEVEQLKLKVFKLETEIKEKQEALKTVFDSVCENLVSGLSEAHLLGQEHHVAIVRYSFNTFWRRLLLDLLADAMVNLNQKTNMQLRPNTNADFEVISITPKKIGWNLVIGYFIDARVRVCAKGTLYKECLETKVFTFELDRRGEITDYDLTKLNLDIRTDVTTNATSAIRNVVQKESGNGLELKKYIKDILKNICNKHLDSNKKQLL